LRKTLRKTQKDRLFSPTQVWVALGTAMTWKQNVLLYIAGIRILINRLLFGWARPKPTEWRFAKALCLGLDGAGKSTLLHRAGDPSAALDGTAPTNGFNVRTVVVLPEWKVEMWDVGGSAAMRRFWGRYVTPDLDALIWVVDGADEARVPESAAELTALLKAESQLRYLPLLIIANKIEEGESANVADRFCLAGLERQRLILGPWHVAAVSAGDSALLTAALAWLSSQLAGAGTPDHA
jgi:hypothetical protein